MRKYTMLVLALTGVTTSVSATENMFSAHECKQERRIEPVRAFNFEFHGESVRILPSDDEYTYISASGNTDALKNLKFNVSGNTLSLGEPLDQATGDTKITNLKIHNTGNRTFVSADNINSRVYTLSNTSQMQNIEADVYLEGSGTCLTFLSNRKGCTLQMAKTVGGWLMSGQITSGQLEYKGVV